MLHLETRAQELDTLLGQPDICSNAAKLMELHTEKESISEQLISLYEIWESLAQ
ncbi:MAG: ABC transporter C-terminal domain-containing protein [Hungatella sp.]